MSGCVVFCGLRLLLRARRGKQPEPKAEGGSRVLDGPTVPEGVKGAPFAADRERAAATAATFVLTVWGYDGVDVDEYWSRVQPLVTVAFYDSPGGAKVEAGAGVAEA